MKAKVLFCAFALVLMTGTAYSQATGTWTGETQGRGGTSEITLTLSESDGTLTGTFEQTGQPEADIADGTAEGDSISFARSLEFGGRGAFNLTYTGVIDGDELTLTVALPAGGRGGGARGGGGGARGGGGRGGGRGGGMPIVLTRQ